MEGEIVFYDQADLDDWRPRPHGLLRELQGTISPLGRLYDEWNAKNRASIDEYDRRAYAMENYERRRYGASGETRPAAQQGHSDGDAALQVSREGL